MELSEPDKAAVLYMEVAKIHEVHNPGNYIVFAYGICTWFEHAHTCVLVVIQCQCTN